MTPPTPPTPPDNPTPDASAPSPQPPPTSDTLLLDVPGYKGPERRNEFRLWCEAVDQRLDRGNHNMKGLRIDLDASNARLDAIKKDLAANTEATAGVKADTHEMLEIFRAMKGAFAVLNWVGRLAKPIGAIAMAAAAVVAAIKGGGGGIK